jgi:type II secretory pathway component PulL
MNVSFVIFCSDSEWAVAKTTDAKCEVVHTANADAAISAIKQLGYVGQGILLALPSQWCLAASVNIQGLLNRNRQSGLLFRLEEQLPLAMEEFVADFITGDEHAFGIAVAIEKLKPIVRLLESQGVFIANVCPVAVLAAYQLSKSDFVIAGSGELLDLITFKQGAISQWTILPADFKTIAPHLSLAAKEKEISGIAISVSESLKNDLAKVPGIQWIEGPADGSMNLAARAAHRILVEGNLPPIELRRGVLAAGDPLRVVRKPLIAAIAAILFLGFSLAASLLIRAGQYDAQVQAAHRNQEQAFHSALPKQVIPPAITSRLVSEQKRLSALSGNTPTTPRDISVLPLLRDVLASLPHNLRFRLTELRFEPNRLYLEGQALDHAAADKIAEAIRHGTRLSVDPPHTQQQPGEDVSFTLTAFIPDTAPTIGTDAQAREGTP